MATAKAQSLGLTSPEANNSITRTWRALFTSKLSVKARLLLATVMYAIATLVVWQHFFHKRLLQMQAKYTDDVTNCDQKVYVAPFVYATKHTILLTMAMLMLTMCRKTVGLLSRTTINRFLPLDITTDMHKVLGIWMVAQTLFASLGFFVQYGSLCTMFALGREDDNYCSMIGGEIFITGECGGTIDITRGCFAVFHAMPVDVSTQEGDTVVQVDNDQCDYGIAQRVTSE